MIVSVKAVEPLDGVSEIAYYDYETGEVLAAIPQEGSFENHHEFGSIRNFDFAKAT